MVNNNIIGIVLNFFIELIAFLLSIILVGKRKSILHGIKTEFNSIIIQLLKLVLVFIAPFFIIEVIEIRLISIFVSVLLAIIIIFYHSIILSKIGEDNSKYQTYDGVFAASAIIMTTDNRFVLVKRNIINHFKENITNQVKKNITDREYSGQWIQPGTYIRTNEIKKIEPGDSIQELPTLYQHLINEMYKETGLVQSDYEYLPLGGLLKEEMPTFTNDDSLLEADRRNLLTPSPFLIQKEKSTKQKSSGKTVHMDCFYAFKLRRDLNEEFLSELMAKTHSSDSKYSNIKAFSFDEIKKLAKEKDQCYKDLTVIIRNFLEIWQKSRYYTINKISLRHCTFNTERNILWLRINQECNLCCKFCLLTNKLELKPSAIFDMPDNQKSSLEKIIKDNVKLISDKKSNKFVVTGGEPFLIKNLSEIIASIVDKCPTISLITICTNGTLWRNHEESIIRLNEKIKNEGKTINFVINMSSCNADMHRNLTGVSDLFTQQGKFINWLNDKNIPFTINVVLTRKFKEMLNDFIDYWRKLKVKNVALAYGVRRGMMNRDDDVNICLNKDECIDLYGKLCSGDCEIEFLDKIKLMLPSCDELNCSEHKNILAIELQNDNFTFIKGCLDRNKRA